jgi:hypothetical protein
MRPERGKSGSEKPAFRAPDFSRPSVCFLRQMGIGGLKPDKKAPGFTVACVAGGESRFEAPGGPNF